MIGFLNCIIWAGLACFPHTPIRDTGVKVTCEPLNLYFMLPSGFATLDSLAMDSLSKRGEKAVRESFNKEIIKGWQPTGVQFQDSLKRTVSLNWISVEEAVAQNGTVNKFIEKRFKDGNDFIVQRIKRSIDFEIDEASTVQQSTITIAGHTVRKNAFTLTYGGRQLFFSRYYFFRKDGKLFLLGFLGSPRSSDNEEIVRAIEQAKSI